MKSYEEMARSVIEKGDVYLAKRERRISAAKKIGTGACAICCAAVFFGVLSYDYEEPDVFNNNIQNIDFRTESLHTTVESTAKATAAHTSSLSSVCTTSSIHTTTASIKNTEPITATSHESIEFSVSDIIIHSEITTSTSTAISITETTVTTVQTAIETTVSSTSTDMMYSGSCGENVSYELNETTRTLYFIGSGSDVDVSAALPLVGKFDTVTIDQGITSFEYISENHLFGTGCPLTIYCYSDFKTDRLQQFLGKHLTFVILDE